MLCGSEAVNQLFSVPFLHIEQLQLFDPGSDTQGSSSLWPVYSVGLTWRRAISTLFGATDVVWAVAVIVLLAGLEKTQAVWEKVRSLSREEEKRECGSLWESAEHEATPAWFYEGVNSLFY